MSPLTLELHFIDGLADGMLTAEVFGWTGHILVTPRTRISEALKRKESDFTGVYILIEDQEEVPKIYIGESEVVASRIKSHDTKKDWWTKAIIITSEANKLHKAHVQYLEARLVEEAKSAKNSRLENHTHPNLPSLTEASRANMENFIEKILLVLPALRVDLFTTKAKPEKIIDSHKTADSDQIFELTLKKEGIVATAKIEDGEFVVQKGSLARGEFIGDHKGYFKLYVKLVEQGILAEHEKQKVFTQSYAFSSTSAAGAICRGAPTAGPVAWKIKGTKKTYRDWEAESLAKNP